MSDFEEFWSARDLPSQEYLKECFIYDAETGLLYWRERPASHFQDRGPGRSPAQQAARCNTQRAGKLALNSIKKNGYRSGALDGVGRYAHRVIWKMEHGEDPDTIDHIDGDKTFNRISNLRDVTQAINSRNRPRGKLNTSGQIGVFFHAQSGGWLAQINSAKGNTLSFYSKDRSEAAAWRSSMEIELGYINRSAA